MAAAARRSLPRPQCGCRTATAIAAPEHDCHAATAMAAPSPHGSTEAAMRLRPTAMAAPRPQCDCQHRGRNATAMHRLPWQHRGRNAATAMQATAMAAPKPQCDCHGSSPLPNKQHRRQCDCHAADCHGSTEAVMQLPASSRSTAMQPTAMATPSRMAAPRPQCDCHEQPRASSTEAAMRYHAARCHNSNRAPHSTEAVMGRTAMQPTA